MLKEEDIVLHGSSIVDSNGLLHGKIASKNKSKSGKLAYTHDSTKKDVDNLFDKDSKENITKSSDDKNVRKKGSIHKGYDATVRALKGLVK